MFNTFFTHTSSPSSIRSQRRTTYTLPCIFPVISLPHTLLSPAPAPLVYSPLPFSFFLLCSELFPCFHSQSQLFVRTRHAYHTSLPLPFSFCPVSLSLHICSLLSSSPSRLVSCLRSLSTFQFQSVLSSFVFCYLSHLSGAPLDHSHWDTTAVVCVRAPMLLTVPRLVSSWSQLMMAALVPVHGSSQYRPLRLASVPSSVHWYLHPDHGFWVLDPSDRLDDRLLLHDGLIDLSDFFCLCLTVRNCCLL